MMKFLKIIGIGVLGIFIFFGAIYALALVNSPNNATTFIPFIEQSIPKLTTWNYNEYEAQISSETLNSMSKKQWELLNNKLSSLGKLESIGTPELEENKTKFTTNNGVFTIAQYLVPITFDTGLAHVRLNMVYDNDEVKIHGFRFLSDRLFE